MMWEVRRWTLVLGTALVGCTTGGEAAVLPDTHFDPISVEDAGNPVVTPQLDGGSEERCTDESRGSTLDEACSTDADCDDGCYCNGVERCGTASVCVAGEAPCREDSIDCTAALCEEETDQCSIEPQHELCSDEDACNGAEMCDPISGCVAAAPLYCNDEDSCTVDSCDAETGCVYTIRDLDGDGHTDGRCGGDDCDDDPRFGTEINPSAAEDCENRRDDNCDGFRDYNDPTCIPTNDTCATARVLSGEGTYSGTTSGLTSDYSLSCLTSGADAVFKFTVDPETAFPSAGYDALDVRLTLAGGGSNAAVALRPWDGDVEGDMAGCTLGADLKCGVGSGVSFLSRSLPAGDYAIIVKTSAGLPFDLDLELGEPTPIPPVDICDGETEDIGAGGTFIGMFEEVEHDYTLSCHSGSWRDAAYTFTIDEPKDVTLTGSTTSGAWTTTYLALVTDAGNTDPGAGCSDSTATLACASGSSAEIRRRELEAGTYYVLLESSRTDAAGWSLDVEIIDPVPRVTGDACSTAVDISEETPGAGGTGTVPLAMMESDFGTSCGGSSSFYRDAFFTFTIPGTEPRDVTLTTTAPGWHYASLGTECGVFSSDIRCTSGGSSITSLVQPFRSLLPGTYVVTVATSYSSGNVTAAIETDVATPVPPNDQCTGSIDISAGGLYDGTTIDFADDIYGCSGASPDAFYGFSLAEQSLATVVVSRSDGTTGYFTLTLRESCSSSSNILCDSGSTAVFSQVLEPGDYVVIVESSVSSAADFRLQSFFSPAP